MKDLCVALLLVAVALVAGCASGPMLPTNDLERMGFKKTGTLPAIPFLNYERIGWLYSANTGKEPRYSDFIMNGEYLEKGARQIPQFCNANRHRQAVCQYMKTSHPKYLEEYTAISKAEIKALANQTEFLMNGAAFKLVSPYDPLTHGQLIEHQGVSGGIVLGKDCWFSHSEKAPHACINIDNIKAVNKSAIAVEERVAKFLREHQWEGKYALLMKVSLRSPFSSTKLYTRQVYMLSPRADLYTAWVVVNTIYLVDDQGNIYYQLTVPTELSEKDRIDRELSTVKPTGRYR